ncbi:MAG: protein kinase [Deltaproteobacteria bacterium]|nr:protein kinase [Deltaproteobacteria bacterium]
MTRYSDRFEPLEEIGSGGMGAVYMARDHLTGETVALKVLFSREGPNAARFAQESSLLAELSHPAIVRYVHHGTGPEGEPYLAMEWLDGHSLEERLARGALSVVETAALAARLLDALAVAHRHGVVHRDLKPENLFLPDGHLAQAKVLDFGIARRMRDQRRLTRAGATLGTPMYMSPEQARGQGDIDHRADIFSLGCVLYECLTGRPPFVGDTAMAVLAKICLESPRRPGKLVSNLSPVFESMVMAMLEKDPRDRSSDTAILAREFSAYEERLRAAGARLADEEKARARLRTPSSLTAPEQRLFSVVMATLPRNRAATGGVTAKNNETDDGLLLRLRRSLAQFGVKADRLYNGSFVVTQAGDGNPVEQAVRAARAALTLRALVPEASIALCTARTDERETLPIGQVLERAGRLVMRASPGQVDLDEASIELLDMRFSVIRNVDGGVVTGVLQFEKGLCEPVRSMFGRPLAFVGRDRELAALEALYDDVVDRQKAQIALVIGKPGSGKSRLRHEFLERIQNRGERMSLLAIYGDVVRMEISFGMLNAAVADDRSMAASLRPEARRRRISSHVPTGVALQKQRDSFIRWITEELQERPVVLVMEELQWADAETLGVVTALLEQLENKPFFVLGAATDELDECFPGLWSKNALNRIPLPPLTHKAGQRLARDLLTDWQEDGVAALVSRADGNPLHLEELLRSALGMGGHSVLESPAGLPDLVRARVASLDEPTRRCLGLASVLGERFTRRALSFLHGDDPSGLERCLGVLFDHEIIFPRRAGTVEDLSFGHELLRQVSYELLSHDDRSAAHLRAAENLKAAPDAEPLVLAYHYALGADVGQSQHFLKLAERIQNPD